VGEEGRVGILMCAGCAFVCLLLFVTLALTQVAMQDRRLVSCADALAGAGEAPPARPLRLLFCYEPSIATRSFGSITRPTVAIGWQAA